MIDPVSIDLGPHVASGDGVWWSQAAAEATPLVDALLDQIGDIGPCRAFCGLTWNPRLARELPEALTVVSYGAMGELRALSCVADAFASGHDGDETAWFVAAQLLDDGHSPCRCAGPVS